MWAFQIDDALREYRKRKRADKTAENGAGLVETAADNTRQSSSVNGSVLTKSEILVGFLQIYGLVLSLNVRGVS